MNEYILILIWLVVFIAIGVLGFIAHAEEISKDYTDTGTRVFIVALVWPVIVGLLLIGLVIAIFKKPFVLLTEYVVYLKKKG